MKLVFLGSSATIIYYMRFHRVVRTTYDREQDTFRALFLIGPCAILALLINQEFSVIEVSRQTAARSPEHAAYIVDTVNAYHNIFMHSIQLTTVVVVTLVTGEGCWLSSQDPCMCSDSVLLRRSSGHFPYI